MPMLNGKQVSNEEYDAAEAAFDGADESMRAITKMIEEREARMTPEERAARDAEAAAKKETRNAKARARRAAAKTAKAAGKS
jgi:hypothetical protein